MFDFDFDSDSDSDFDFDSDFDSDFDFDSDSDFDFDSDSEVGGDRWRGVSAHGATPWLLFLPRKALFILPRLRQIHPASGP